MSNELQKKSIQIELDNLESRIFWSKQFAWLLVISGIVAAAWGLCVLGHDATSSSLLEKLSLVGSFFQGAIGSLWALAGLMFIYVAFLGQKQQLLLQREEMEGQEEQFRLQQESIKRQNFESAFFQLLNLHGQNISQMRQLKQNTQTHEVYVQSEGRACFMKWLNEFHRQYKGQRPTDEQFKDQQFAIESYLKIYNEYQTHLAHYFRTLYHVFKFVDESDIGDKHRYTSLARAQLSAAEIVFIFYNGISPFGEKFKPLIEKYGLLEHINESLLLHSSHEDFYDEKAFK